MSTNSINLKTFDQLPKNNLQILAVDQNFLKAKIPLLELSIKWKDQVKFDQVSVSPTNRCKLVIKGNRNVLSEKRED